MTYVTGHAGFRVLLWPLWGKVTLFCRLLVCGDHYVWSYWFSGIVVSFMRVVTLCCRMLVLMRLLRVVILVFEKYLDLYRERLLFVVGCWLWCDRYTWSYWFSLSLIGTAVFSPLWIHTCCLCDLYDWLLRFFRLFVICNVMSYCYCS